MRGLSITRNQMQDKPQISSIKTNNMQKSIHITADNINIKTDELICDQRAAQTSSEKDINNDSI